MQYNCPRCGNNTFYVVWNGETLIICSQCEQELTRVADQLVAR